MRTPLKVAAAIASLTSLSILVSAPAFAATAPTYTVSVNGSWSGSWSATAQDGGAAPVTVPANQSFTPTGNLTVTVPPLPSGDSYDGSWALYNPPGYSNTWCGIHAPNHGEPTFSIPANGGTFSEPLSVIWGTMPPETSTPAACVIEVSPPVLLGPSGTVASQPLPNFDLSLPVKVKPAPSPSPTPSPSATSTPPASSASPTPTTSTPPSTSARVPSGVSSPSAVAALPVMAFKGLPQQVRDGQVVPFTVVLDTPSGQPVNGKSVLGSVSGGKLAATTGMTDSQGVMSDQVTVTVNQGTVNFFAVGAKVHAVAKVPVIKNPKGRKVIRGGGTMTGHPGVHPRIPKASPHAGSHRVSPMLWGFLLILLLVAALLAWVWLRRRQVQRKP